MKSCVAVGKHLAAVREAEQDQEEKTAGGGDAAWTDVLQVLWAAGRPGGTVCVWGGELSCDGER